MPGTVEQQRIGSYLFVRAVRNGRTLHVEYRLDDQTRDARQEYDGDDEIGDPAEWSDDELRKMACFMLGIDQRHAAKVEVVGL
jgi:hypothetical protein